MAWQISDVIKDHPAFAKDLDWSARPGTKTYPRWKDALIGCFKVPRLAPDILRASCNGCGKAPAAEGTAASAVRFRVCCTGVQILSTLTAKCILL